MTSKACRDTRREIDELELGERPGEPAASHLAACAPCRTFRAERTALRELAGSLEPVSAPADFDMRLRARLASERSRNRPQPFFARLLSTPALAAAALFVIVAASLWILQRQYSTVPSNPLVVATNNGSNPPAATSTAPVSTSSGTSEEVPAGPDVIAGTENNKEESRPVRVRPSRTADFDVKPVNSVRQDERAYVPSRPVEFSLQDERGNTRRISLPPVSFGAQNLVDNRTAVSYSPNSRVW